jgi:hypothetical protein
MSIGIHRLSLSNHVCHDLAKESRGVIPRPNVSSELPWIHGKMIQIIVSTAMISFSIIIPTYPLPKTQECTRCVNVTKNQDAGLFTKYSLINRPQSACYINPLSSTQAILPTDPSDLVEHMQTGRNLACPLLVTSSHRA